jgi:arylamine N-acetyltransferase
MRCGIPNDNLLEVGYNFWLWRGRADSDFPLFGLARFLPNPGVNLLLILAESSRRTAMSDERLDHHLLQQYLDILGAANKVPSHDALTELVTAQLTRVPFENISKLYYRKHLGLTDLPTLPQYLDGIAQNHFGGTCYSNNYYFYCLLASLGYKVELCAADMTAPAVHAFSLVRVEGREYLVDTGYAAPFLSPLPRDLMTDYTVELGRDRYVLRPQDGNGCSRLDLYRDGILKHGYLARPEPRRIEDFSGVIKSSFGPDATFLNSLLLARFYPGRSVVIHNFALIESQGTVFTIRRLNGLDELISSIEERFDMSRRIVAEALSGLEKFRDAWYAAVSLA